MPSSFPCEAIDDESGLSQCPASLSSREGGFPRLFLSTLV